MINQGENWSIVAQIDQVFCCQFDRLTSGCKWIREQQWLWTKMEVYDEVYEDEILWTPGKLSQLDWVYQFARGLSFQHLLRIEASQAGFHLTAPVSLTQNVVS